jgi:hypothetical protein
MKTSVKQLECVLCCSRTVVYVTAQTHTHKSSLLHLQNTQTVRARSSSLLESLSTRELKEKIPLWFVRACVRARERERCIKNVRGDKELRLEQSAATHVGKKNLACGKLC